MGIHIQEDPATYNTNRDFTISTPLCPSIPFDIDYRFCFQEDVFGGG
jgi:hypothetical protein